MAQFYTQDRVITFFNSADVTVGDSTDKISNTGTLRTVDQFSFPSNVIGCNLSIKGYNLEINAADAAPVMIIGFGVNNKNIIGTTVIYSIIASFISDSDLDVGPRLNKSTWIEVSAVAQCE